MRCSGCGTATRGGGPLDAFKQRAGPLPPPSASAWKSTDVGRNQVDGYEAARKAEDEPVVIGDAFVVPPSLDGDAVFRGRPLGPHSE